jgi:hypothetical protein
VCDKTMYVSWVESTTCCNSKEEVLMSHILKAGEFKDDRA